MVMIRKFLVLPLLVLAAAAGAVGFRSPVSSPPAPVPAEVAPRSPVSQTGSSGSGQYVVVPLTVNVVNGTTVNNATLAANVAKLNEIYNCEVVIFTWNGTVRVIPDPNGNPDGSGDGTIPDDFGNRTSVRGRAATNAGGKGVSVTLAKSLGDDNLNGITVLGEAHSALVRSDADGSTWAHELQHALNQTNGQARPADEDLDGDGSKVGDYGWDVNGDGNVTNADRWYNLWGCRQDRLGNNMTALQHAMIFGNASRLPGANVKTRPASSSSSGTAFHGGTRGAEWADPFADSLADGSPFPWANPADLIGAGLAITFDSSGAATSLAAWTTASAWGLEPVQYDVYLDSDLDSGTGSNAQGEVGADWRVYTYSDFTGALFSRLYWWNQSSSSWDAVGLGEPGWFVQKVETVGNCTGSGPNGFSVGSSRATFNATFAGLLPTGWGRAWATSLLPGEVAFTDSTEAATIWLGPHAPSIFASGENLTLGTTARINGTHFAPGSTVALLLHGYPVGGNATGSSGEFALEFNVTGVPPTNNAILVAFDPLGGADALYVNVLPGTGGGGGAGAAGVVGLGEVGLAWLLVAAALGVSAAWRGVGRRRVGGRG
ncbi:MAG: hypothetical protein Kow0069_27330 [Promethearchaeota archaeon]